MIPNGLKFLIEGYIDYAKDIALDRAIPSIDGLKPSQRRIIYAYHLLKPKGLVKSATVVGKTLEYHPHGDAPTYDALCRMVDSAYFMNVPFFIGEGNFGDARTKASASAMRYTSVEGSPILKEFLRDLDGTVFVPTEDGNKTEPMLLPVSYPALLTIASTGIAVGLASNIPSFNFNEVLKATIEYIETGDIKKPLVPDFATGGYFVYNEKELNKLMNEGKAKLQFRGKWYVEGKNIIIEEVPYYTTSQAIKKKIIENENVSKVVDLVGFDTSTNKQHNELLLIECKNKRVVDNVINDLLRDTDLQLTSTANVTIVHNDTIKKVGIKEIIKLWVEFRKSVLEKLFKKDLDNVLALIPRYELLVDLLSDEGKRKVFVDTLSKKGELEARGLLSSWYPHITDESIYDWVLDMKIRSFSNNGEKQRQYLEGLYEKRRELEWSLNNLDKVIVNQLKELDNKYKFPRKTEITDIVIDPEKKVKVVEKPKAVPCLVELNGKFIKKLPKITVKQKGRTYLECMSDSVISFIDTKGRMLRVYLSHLDFQDIDDKGVYLPVYLGVEDDFDIVAFTLVEDKKLGYLYKDGYVSVVDYSEFLESKRSVKVVKNGVSDLAKDIIYEFPFSEEGCIAVLTNKGKIGFFAKEAIQVKTRTARSKAMYMGKDEYIVRAVECSYYELTSLFGHNLNELHGRVKKLKDVNLGVDDVKEFFNLT